MDNLESKYIGGSINTKAIKVIEKNGVPVGIFEAYIATFDIDEPDFFGERDRFKKGAFLGSLAEHRERDNRQIRLKDLHGRTVGGFPIETAKEDDIGLFAIGEINLDVQQGAEMFALMRQGVLVDMSIGFQVVESETDNELRLRTIEIAKVFEGSVVDEPRNRKAKIIGLKNFDMDAAKACLNQDCRLDDKTIAEVLESLGKIVDDTKSDSIPSITLADVEKIENIKGIESLLRKFGFSENAAKTMIRKTKEFKSSDQREVGKGNLRDDQREAEDQTEALTRLGSMTKSIDERSVLSKLTQLTDKVN